MKNTIKFLALGLMVVAFGAISVSSIFAQATAEECATIYNDKFLKDRKGPTIEKYQSAIAAGKEYLSKCGSLEGDDNATIKDYVTKQIPKLEAIVKDMKFTAEVIDPFNKSVPAKDWATAFNTGKQFIAANPDSVDVMLVLASIGFDNATANPAVDTYNSDTIAMAKMALAKMAENKPSGSGNYGAFAYTYKTTACDGKLNATGWMNYTIGNITYYRLKNQKEALPYLYKSTQMGCETKNIANIYRMIGAWYIDEFKKIDDERTAKIKAAGDQDTDETKAMFGLQKGYMERVAEAYSRAYKAAMTDKAATAEFKNSLLNRSKEFYGYRFDKVMTGYDAWSAGLNSKTFSDPTTAVVPVVDATPSTSTTPAGASTMTTDTTKTPATADTRPRTATTTTAKPTTTTATAAGATTAAAPTTKKAPAKKPAKKKKGTR